MLRASSFSLVDSIGQVLVTNSGSIVFISFKSELCNIHLASSSPLHSNSKKLSVAVDTPFSNTF